MVEVAPPYDHAEITGIAASHMADDLVSQLALRHRADQDPRDEEAVATDMEGPRA